jgi:hypothetical protein
LSGSFIRKRNRENCASGDALFNQMSDSVCNRASFARAGARKDQDGAFSGCRSFTLPGIQFFKECHVGE